MAAKQKARKKALDELIEREQEEIEAAEETAELRERLAALAERNIEGSSGDSSDSEGTTGSKGGSSKESELAWDYSADRESPKKPEDTNNDSVFEAVNLN